MRTLPTFVTNRLFIRPRTLADLPACLAMDRDPDVTRFVPGPWSDPERHEAFVRERIEADFGEGLGYWSVFERERPETLLGWILLIPCEGTGPDIEIGWRFVKDAWGKGYATEAARPVLRHAFDTLGLNRLIADIDSRNHGSVRVALKIGMRDHGEREHEGIRCRSFVITR